MHASASQLALVLLLIGRKGGANLLSQSHRVESAKPITFRHSNENRSILLQLHTIGPKHKDDKKVKMKCFIMIIPAICGKGPSTVV